MKKRMQNMFLILLLLLICAVPSFAAEAKFDNPGLEAAYQAHLVLKAALCADTKDVAALAEAMDAQEAANEAADMDWDDMQMMPEDYFSVMVDASSVIRFGELRDAFLAEKNCKTARELMELEASLAELDSVDLVKSFFSDYDEVCAEAEKAAPSENTLAVYHAFYPLNEELEMAFWVEDLAVSLADFRQVEVQFEALTEKELGDLAILLTLDTDVTPQQTKDYILDVASRAEHAVAIMDIYYSYSELFNSGIAEEEELESAGKEFAGVIDQVMANADEAQTMILYTLYPELEYLYNQAKVYSLSEEAGSFFEGIKAFREVIFCGQGAEAFEAAADTFEQDVLPKTGEISEEELQIIAIAADCESTELLKDTLLRELNDVKEQVETAKGLKETLPSVKFHAKSVKTMLRGKQAVKVTWDVPEDVELDGYQVFRSTQRYKGYGTEPYFEAWNPYYINNKEIEKGNTYYYKVRGYRYLCNEYIYTDWSWKAWRTF